jgi:hypothetical protein
MQVMNLFLLNGISWGLDFLDFVGIRGLDKKASKTHVPQKQIY